MPEFEARASPLASPPDVRCCEHRELVRDFVQHRRSGKRQPR